MERAKKNQRAKRAERVTWEGKRWRPFPFPSPPLGSLRLFANCFCTPFHPVFCLFSLPRSLVPGYSFPCSSKLYEIHYLNSQYKRIGPTNILKLPSHAPYKIQRHNNTLRTLFFVVRTVSYDFSFFPIDLWLTPLGNKSTGKNLVCK